VRRVTLGLSEPGVDRKAVFANEMGDDGIAVANRLCFVEDIRKLTARRSRRIENVLVPKGHPGKPQENTVRKGALVGPDLKGDAFFLE
jgi:hypothetical protein